MGIRSEISIKLPFFSKYSFNVGKVETKGRVSENVNSNDRFRYTTLVQRAPKADYRVLKKRSRASWIIPLGRH